MTLGHTNLAKRNQMIRKMRSAGTNSAILGIRISAPPDSVPSAKAKVGVRSTEAKAPSATPARSTFFMTSPSGRIARYSCEDPAYLTTSATTKPIRARASAKAEPMMKTVNTRS